VAAIVSGYGWGAVAAAVAAAVLLVVLEALARLHRATVDDAGFLHEKYVQLARDHQQCRETLRRQAGEAVAREEAHHAVLASWAALQLVAGHVASAVIPAALAGDPLPPAPREAGDGDGQAGAVFGPVVSPVAEGAARLRGQLDERAESSRLAVVMLARRVQASAHRIQEEASVMAEGHGGDALGRSPSALRPANGHNWRSSTLGKRTDL
jgi:hypothetical protein